MVGQPAARLGDPTGHGDPLKPGICSSNVLIGGQRAWRALSPLMVKQLTDLAEQATESATKAINAPDEVSRTKFMDELKNNVTDMLKIMASTDQHVCTVVKVVVPDGNGVVIKGSSSVLINGLPACRKGDPILETTSVNTIAGGCPTVKIGG